MENKQLYLEFLTRMRDMLSDSLLWKNLVMDNTSREDTSTEQAENILHAIQNSGLNELYKLYWDSISHDTGIKICYGYFKDGCVVETYIIREFDGDLPYGTSYNKIYSNINELNKFVDKRYNELNR